MTSRRRTSTLSTLLCASLLLLAGGVRAGRACGWSPSDVAEETFFAPDVIGRPADAPFFYDPYAPFGGPVDVQGIDEANAREWSQYFGGKLPPEPWAELLYNAPLDRVDHLIFALQGKAKPVEDDAAFLAYADRPRLVGALYYAGFAKRVEPIATSRKITDPWETPPPMADPAEAKPLLDAGNKGLPSVKDPFLRQRWAFQLLRLHFFTGDWEGTIGFWNEHAADFAPGGSPRWRALGYVAGAFYRSKRYAESNVAYAQVFDSFAPLRDSAFWAFHPQEEADWRAALAKAGNVRLKTVLWQMLGIRNDGPRALRTIHALDPKSDLLPLLLAREVNKLEITRGFNWQSNVATRSEAADGALRTFIEERAAKGDVAEPWLWELAAAHLQAVWGERGGAERLLDRAAAHAPPRPEVQHQLRVSRLLARVVPLTVPDVAAEPWLARELTWVRDMSKRNDLAKGSSMRMQALLDTVNARLSALYLKAGNPVLSVCLKDDESSLYRDPKGIEALTRFLDRKDKTAFEAYAASLHRTPRPVLTEIKALAALYAGDIETAAQVVTPKKGALLETPTLNADPFHARINDCHDCDAADPKHAVYTKAEVIARLDTLRREAERSPKVAAQNWFEIGTALYNITYYGNSRVMYDDRMPQFTPRDEPQLDSRGYYRGYAPLPGQLERAMEYFRKAHDAATDRELKAQAAFMAAKCELGIFYIQRKFDIPDFIAGKWFHMLRDHYADTKYYAEVLKECGYFRTFTEETDRAERH